MKHLLPGLVLLLFACGQADPHSTDPISGADTAAASVPVIDLSAYDVPLLFTPLDQQLTGGDSATIAWKEETGQLIIKAGDHFGLAIIEDAGDVARLKADLDRDLLRKNSILREVPGTIVYKSEFPGDAGLVQVHFYQVLSAGGRTFVVQDLDAHTYTEQDVDRMIACLVPKPSA